ncbi:MAG: YmdB family metallophosphoesterase [Treponema sp.]|jgi:metallophosphoesterase (TIGR00282 family)|nr:YmdB family metallophosphoesterase [Treponema sp.]
MVILYVAEIVGKAGVFAVKQGLPELKKRKRIDFVIANADGATGGGGLGRNHAAYLRKLGLHILTLGECAFYKKDLVETIDKMPYVLRPGNLSSEAPGYGSYIYKLGEVKIAVAVIIGQSGFSRMHGDNPAALLPSLLERLHKETPIVIVDFHAGATAEKRTLFAVADGLCTAVIGSHTRVQTADEAVSPKGTAVITDAGRTGSVESVGGADAQTCIQEYLTGIPDWTKETWAKLELQGVLLDVNKNGKALSIERVRLPVMGKEDHEGQNP